MRNIIDMHGYNETEAHLIIDAAIEDFFANDLYYELEIITGKGDTLTYVCESILIDKNLKWHHEFKNIGSYIVRKDNSYE